MSDRTRNIPWSIVVLGACFLTLAGGLGLMANLESEDARGEVGLGEARAVDLEESARESRESSQEPLVDIARSDAEEDAARTAVEESGPNYLRVLVLDQESVPRAGVPVGLRFYGDEPTWAHRRDLMRRRQAEDVRERVLNDMATLRSAVRAAEALSATPASARGTARSGYRAPSPQPRRSSSRYFRGARTRSDGIAVFDVSSEPPGTYHVGLDVPMEAAIEASVRIPRESSEEVRLVLPAVSAVRFRVQNDLTCCSSTDIPWMVRVCRPSQTTIEMVGGPWTVTESWVRLEPGEVLTRYASIGLSLLLQGWPRSGFAQSMSHEVRAVRGEQEVLLRASSFYTGFVGRLVGADGRPLENALLHTRVQSTDADGRWKTHEVRWESEKDGRIHFHLGPPADGAQVRVACIVDSMLDGDDEDDLPDVGPAEIYLDLTGRQSPGTIVDLGELRPGSGPLLLAGQVVDPSGMPLVGAHVHFHDLHENAVVRPTEEDVEVVSKDRLNRARTSADGRFERTGLARGPAIQISATKSGFIPAERQLFRVGERDARIVLTPKGSLYGQFLYDDEDQASLVVIEARSAEGEGPTFRAYIAKGEFYQFRTIAAGRTMLTAEISGVRLFTHESLEIPQVSEEGPLQGPTIDLRGGLQSIEIELKNAEGFSIPNIKAFIHGRYEDQTFACSKKTDPRGKLGLTLPSGCRDLRIIVPGIGKASLRAQSGLQHIQLTK